MVGQTAIRTVQRENLQRLDDDIAILKKYLKTEDVPKALARILGTTGLSGQLNRL